MRQPMLSLSLSLVEHVYANFLEGRLSKYMPIIYVIIIIIKIKIKLIIIIVMIIIIIIKIIVIIMIVKII